MRKYVTTRMERNDRIVALSVETSDLKSKVGVILAAEQLPLYECKVLGSEVKPKGRWKQTV